MSSFLVAYSFGLKLDFKNLALEKTGGIYLKSEPPDVLIFLDNQAVKNQSGILQSGTLIDNLKEYFSIGEEAFKRKSYNSAVTLYFKSIIASVDLFLLLNTGNSPSSHPDRFRVCQEKFQEIYSILDKDFPFYQNSYSHILSKELAEVLRQDAEVMARKAKVKLR